MGIQKAIVAIIGGAVIIINEIWGVDLGITDMQLSSAVTMGASVLTALGVYGFTNK